MKYSDRAKINENKIKKSEEFIKLLLCFNCQKCIPEIIPIIIQNEHQIKTICPFCGINTYSFYTFVKQQKIFEQKLNNFISIDIKNNCKSCGASNDHKNELLFCIQCNSWFCSDCRVKHNSLLNNDYRDGSFGNIVNNSIMPHVFIKNCIHINNCCPLHSYKTKITYYCVECAQCTCIFCNENTHSGHNVISLGDFIQKKSKEVLSQIGPCLKEINEKKEEIKRINSKDKSPIQLDLDFEKHDEINNFTQNMINIIFRDCETLMSCNVFDINLLKNLKTFTSFFESKKNNLPSENQTKILTDLYLFKAKNEDSKWSYEQYKLTSPIYSICKFKKYLLISQGKAFQFRHYPNILEVKSTTVTKKETHTLCVVKTENGRFLIVTGEENLIKIYIINQDYSTILFENSSQKTPIKLIKTLEDKSNIIVTAAENFKVKLWKLSESNNSHSSVTSEYDIDKQTKTNKLYSMEKIMDNVLIFGGHSYMYLKNENSFVNLDYKIKIHSDIITCFLAFNNTIFLSGSKDTTINIREYISPLKQEQKGVFTKHFSPIVGMFKFDDNQVISCSENGLILVWDVFNLEISIRVDSTLDCITHFLYFNNDFVIINKNKMRLYKFA